MAVSQQMYERLAKIQDYIQAGYRLNSEINLSDLISIINVDILINSSGKRVKFIHSPGGWSWIAFWFPFCVFAQIRHWRYFLDTSFLLLMVAITSCTLHKFNLTSFRIYNITFSVFNLLIWSFSAIYFPYCRYLAKEKGIKDIPVLASIFLGILLFVLATLPSVIVEILCFRK